MKRLLILGGTGDAANLIERAGQLPGLTVIASLAGRTPKPNIPRSGLVRIGGFGGVAGLIDYLRREQVDLLVDATHPFATQISDHAARAAAVVGIPRLMLRRPQWEVQPGDHWLPATDSSGAAALLPGLGRRIFLTVGRQPLPAFAHLQQLWFLMRMITPPAGDAPTPPGQILLDQGPFTLTNEQALLTEHRIEVLVSKNSGGGAAYAKIHAARELGLPVVMISRPPLPTGEMVSDVEGSLNWIARNQL